MIPILLLIGGIPYAILYAIRRPKLKALTAEQFPGVPPDKFAEWQMLELKSISWNLWTCWGLLLIATPLYIFLASFPHKHTLHDVVTLLYPGLVFVWSIFVVRSQVKASKLKKQLGIKWPKKTSSPNQSSRLILTLLLASTVAVVQLAAEQTKADQRPIGEVKAKAEAGDAESQVQLGLRYDKGEGVAKDHAEGARWYRKAADQNYARAQYALGLCYLDGEGVPKNQVEGVKWLRKAAEQNFAGAQYNLGVCYAHGTGVAKDPVEAVKWYRKAAEQNFAEAQDNLGVCYAHGEGVAKDLVEAAKWYRKAAEQNDAEAQFNLGNRYLQGEGVAKDQVEAAKWYRKAAEQNLARAQYNLGVCFYAGAGVAKDQVEAVKWVRKAAEQNLAEAQNNLGNCYAHGTGVAKDPAEAVKWFRKAAEQNYAEAQYNLGVCYVKGEGVAKDYAEAYKWWLLAAGQGFEGARQNITTLKNNMTPEQIAKGQKLAGEFKPRSSSVSNAAGDQSNPATAQANSRTKPLLNSIILNQPSRAPDTSPHIRGDPDAPVRLEVFEDFACKPCAQQSESLKQLEQTYHGKVQVIFHNFPLASHPYARKAAYAAEAAALQDRFWEMHDILYRDQARWVVTDTIGLSAANIRLEMTRYALDSGSEAVRQRVEADQKKGAELGVTRLPAIFINGRLLDQRSLNPGGLRSEIDRALNGSPSP